MTFHLPKAPEPPPLTGVYWRLIAGDPTTQGKVTLWGHGDTADEARGKAEKKHRDDWASYTVVVESKEWTEADRLSAEGAK